MEFPHFDRRTPGNEKVSRWLLVDPASQHKNQLHVFGALPVAVD
jgi:hypothetical protein